VKREIEQKPRAPMRSLVNYIAQHKEKHPAVLQARTLTEARILCFGVKQSLHGIRGKTLDSAGRSFWLEKGCPV